MAQRENVTYAKPKLIGAVSVAPVGTALPTDAKAELDPAFKDLGYISEDGFTNENSPESEEIKAWGGDTVLVVQSSKTDKFTYTLIEALNVEVLKQVYGTDNVKGTLDTGITIAANATPLTEQSVVIDMVLVNGVLKRIVIPKGSVIEVGETTYVDGEPIGYETTLQALPDSKGNTHYEYIVKAE